jgi:hypothetical protein
MFKSDILLEIVILSLVRNSGASDDIETTGFASSGRANIGFLKVGAGYLLHVALVLKLQSNIQSENRTNGISNIENC